MGLFYRPAKLIIMKLKQIITILLTVFYFSGYAQTNKIKFVEYDLPNGLHVILHEDHKTPIVAVSVLYHVGSKNEAPNRTGFAHFFEHLLFEGSENVKRGEFDKYIENAGGMNNANTWYDRTFYYEVFPSNQLKLGLWLESERMLHAKVDSVGIETQRQVVKEERRQRIDNQPYGSVLEETMKRLIVKHPYHHSVIGSMAHLDAAVEQDYIDFYKTYYVPNNAVLSIAGDINIAETKKEILKYFGSIPTGTRPMFRPNVVEPPMTKQIVDTVYDNIQLPAIILGYQLPAQGTKDAYAVEMLNSLLAGGNSSRFNKALVDEQQKAVYIGSFPMAMEDMGAGIAFGISNMGVALDDLLAGMDAEVKKVQTDLIPDREFQKLRNQMESDFVQGNEKMVGIAENLANYHVYFGNADLINTELNRYLDVTREDIRRVAQKYYNPDHRVVLYYLPKPKTP